MSLNSNYITALDLNQYLVNKADGTPLAGGIISFYEDSSRTTPKAVYELSGSPPNYTYTALPNSLTLSSVGTIVDAGGNQVALYYYPYDANGDIQLYYIVVTDADGNPQFTREAWPNVTAESSPASEINNTVINQLSNPQFAEVFFNPAAPWTISFAATGNYTYNIGPDWYLDVGASGAGTVVVTRTAIAGITQYPTNAPYTISFMPGTNITSLNLRQRLHNNPNIWAPKTGGDAGCVAFNIVLAPDSQVSATYKPNNGTPTVIFNQDNTSGVPTEYSTVTQLPPADSLYTADTGWVDINISLGVTAMTTLTSVQIIEVDSPQITGIMYNQAPVNRQVDQLFNYYNAPLQYKPIPSYLVGWDFPLNPAQALGPTVSAFATGANTSNYVWDQTICFQTANSGVSFSRDSHSGGLVVTGAATGQFALIQYIDMPTAYQILNQQVSVNVSAVTNVIAGVEATIQLYYCTDASVPVINSPTYRSLVGGLNADGSVSSVNGAWIQIPRNLNNATFTVETSSTTNFNDYGFTGWNLEGAAAINTATYVAIVVGFAPIASTNTITFNSISLVPGSIPTRPAPQTLGDVLSDCGRYYETSYPAGSQPGAVTSAGCLTALQTYTQADINSHWNSLASAFGFVYLGEKRNSSPVVTLYSDKTGTSGNVSCHMQSSVMTAGPSVISADAALASYWGVYSSGAKSVDYQTANNGSTGLFITQSAPVIYPPISWITWHYTSDARLGVV